MGTFYRELGTVMNHLWRATLILSGSKGLVWSVMSEHGLVNSLVDTSHGEQNHTWLER
jgi:hypothetical protein